MKATIYPRGHTATITDYTEADLHEIATQLNNLALVEGQPATLRFDSTPDPSVDLDASPAFPNKLRVILGPNMSHEDAAELFEEFFGWSVGTNNERTAKIQATTQSRLFFCTRYNGPCFGDVPLDECPGH